MAIWKRSNGTSCTIGPWIDGWMNGLYTIGPHANKKPTNQPTIWVNKYAIQYEAWRFIFTGVTMTNQATMLAHTENWINLFVLSGPPSTKNESNRRHRPCLWTFFLCAINMTPNYIQTPKYVGLWAMSIWCPQIGVDYDDDDDDDHDDYGNSICLDSLCTLVTVQSESVCSHCWTLCTINTVFFISMCALAP